MKLILQPDGSSLCGQCCVAMAAGVSLKRAIEAVGHERGTYTCDVVRALWALGVQCDDRCTRISRKRPNLPKRGLVAIHRPKEDGKRRERFHWMLTWDGRMYDPGGAWPDGFAGWRITSYLTIHT